MISNAAGYGIIWYVTYDVIFILDIVLLTNSAAIFARVMGAKFFSKYFKELKSSAKPYYALSGHVTPRLHPTITCSIKVLFIIRRGISFPVIILWR